MSTSENERTVWWAICDDCDCVTAVWRHVDEPEDTPAPDDDDDEWDDSWSCPVCGGSLMRQWDSDPMSHFARGMG